jgi:hypothetical protein
LFALLHTFLQNPQLLYAMKMIGFLALHFLVTGMSARVRTHARARASCPANKKYMIGKAAYCKPPGQNLMENIGGFLANELNCIATFCAEEQEKGKDPQPCCDTLNALKGDEFGVGSPLYLTKAQDFKDALKEGLGLEGAASKEHSEGLKPWEKDAANKRADNVPQQVEKPEDTGPTEYCWCATVHNGFGRYPKTDKRMVGPTGYCNKDDPCNTCSRREKSGNHNALYECCLDDNGEKTSTCGSAEMPTFTPEDKCFCGGKSYQMSQMFEDNPECRPPKSNCKKCRYDCA